MRIGFLVGVGLFALGAASAADELTVAVRLEPPFVKTATEQTLRVDRGQVLAVDAREVGATVEGALVTINDPAGAGAQCRVQTQYETSATINSEVPHVNLLDGVHFTSEWVDAQRTRKNWFRIPVLTAADRARFPSVAAWELPQEVSSRGGAGVAEPVGTVERPHDARMAVDVSAIRIRILCGAGATPEVYSTIEFQVVKGC